MDLKKDVVLITGGSSGIGYELAKQFAERGYPLVLLARHKEKLERAAEVIEARFYVPVTIIVKDLGQPCAAEEIVAELRGKNIHIDILINNAGIGLYGYFDEIDLREHEELIYTNILSLTKLTWLLLPSMIEHRSGKILNVASLAAFQPGPLMATYYASKAYVLSFSEALTSELRHTGITVTALCPGPTLTEFQKKQHMENTMLFSHPMPMTAHDVAQIGYNALMNEKPAVIAGLRNKLIAFTERFLPLSTITQISRKLLEKRV